MRKRFFIILGAVFCMAAMGCNNAKKADKQAESLVFDQVMLDTTVAYSKEANSPQCNINIQLYYAKGPNAHIINDSILKSGIFLDEELKRGEKKTVPKAVDIVVKNHIKNFKKTCKEILDENGDAGSISQSYFGVKSQVSYGRDSIINFKARYDSYMGGAHGFYNSYALNFEPKTGKLIKINDFVEPGSEDKLLDLIVNKIAQKFGCANLDDLKCNEGVFDIMDPYLPDNFIIGKDSVTFFYQCEEIGPYAIGEVEAKFSLDELKGMVR